MLAPSRLEKTPRPTLSLWLSFFALQASIKTPVMTLPLHPGLGPEAAALLAVRLKRIRLAEALKSELGRGWAGLGGWKLRCWGAAGGGAWACHCRRRADRPPACPAPSQMPHRPRLLPLALHSFLQLFPPPQACRWRRM